MRIDPIAEALRARGAPFMFATRYGSVDVDEAWRSVVRIGEEPHRLAAAINALRRAQLTGAFSRPGVQS